MSGGRTPAPSGRAGNLSRLEIADTPALTSTDAAGAGTLVVQHPERGGILTRSADQTAPANKVTRFNVGGVFYSRSAPPREWRADWVDVAGDWGGDWGAALSNLTNVLMRDGDRLIMPTRVGNYSAQTPWVIRRPISLDASDAVLVTAGEGFGIDCYPSGTRDDNGQPRYHVGGYGDVHTYRLNLPTVRRAYGSRRGQGTGVRITNAFHGVYNIPESDGFGLGVELYADRSVAFGKAVGTAYSDLRIGKLTNLVNLRIAPDLALAATNGLHAFTTANEIRVRSFTSPGDLPTDKSGHTHVVYDSPSWARHYANVLHAGRFEGEARVMIDARGHTIGNEFRGAVFEMPFATALLKTSPTTDGYVIEDGGGVIRELWKTPGLLQDSGTRTRITGGGYALGSAVSYLGGRWTVAQKQITDNNNAVISAPLNWQPERLTDELIRKVYPTGTAAATSLDLRQYRRISIEPGAGATFTTYDAGFITLNNIPDAAVVEAEIEVRIYNAPGHTYTSPYPFPDIQYGSYPQLSSAANTWTCMKLRRMKLRGTPVWVVFERWDT